MVSQLLLLALAEVLLAGGMKLRAVPFLLVARAGVAHALTSCQARAVLRAVDVTVVAAPADPDLTLAALAVEKSAVVLEHRDPKAPRARHTAGITA